MTIARFDILASKGLPSSSFNDQPSQKANKTGVDTSVGLFTIRKVIEFFFLKTNTTGIGAMNEH